jgi:hypothetical protein
MKFINRHGRNIPVHVQFVKTKISLAMCPRCLRTAVHDVSSLYIGGGRTDAKRQERGGEKTTVFFKLFTLVVELPAMDLPHLLPGAKVNCPKPMSGVDWVKTQMQMPRMLHGLGKLE